MTAARADNLLRHLRTLMGSGCAAEASDGQLLARFAAGRDEEAFAALVRRHGPMVLGVCRRVVRHAHDAEDAFQAAFLVLARRGESVRPRDMVGPWLCGVAWRAAMKARCRTARRLSREYPLDEARDVVTRPPQ